MFVLLPTTTTSYNHYPTYLDNKHSDGSGVFNMQDSRLTMQTLLTEFTHPLHYLHFLPVFACPPQLPDS